MQLKPSVDRIFLASRLNPNLFEILKNERDIFYEWYFKKTLQNSSNFLLSLSLTFFFQFPLLNILSALCSPKIFTRSLV